MPKHETRPPGFTFERWAVFTTCTILIALNLLTSPATSAQTYSVLYNFSGGPGGAYPLAGVVMSHAGNLCGTTFSGGVQQCCFDNHCNDCGLAFQLNPTNGQYKLLWEFTGGNDGAYPEGELLVGPSGEFYGNTSSGGLGGLGTVFRLTPPTTPPRDILEARWSMTVLHGFVGDRDGAEPTGPLVIDHSGNLYGSTYAGGSGGNWGTVYELSPSNGSWSESILYRFTDDPDGAYPADGVTFDGAGNLYGTTEAGGRFDSGTAYQLLAGAGWEETILTDFQQGGFFPQSGVTFDSSGNLYSSTAGGGAHGGGILFELSAGEWAFNELYGLDGDDCGPAYSRLIFDQAGNLYGTTQCGGRNRFGSVFKLTPSTGGWNYTSLYDFTGGSDGAYPYGTLLLDANGNLYGTASQGGQYDKGVVFRIAPW